MLARKTRQLSGLFKAKQDKKVADFLLRDFDTDESARASACKNAYSLLAKHQVLGALAFFVLARRIDDALHLLLHNLEEMHLAVVLVRLAAASPQEETALLHSLLTDTVIPFAEARGDRGLLHLCLWRLSRPAAAAAALWIRDPSCAHLTAVEGQVASSSRTPGLLSRLTAATDQETTGSSNAVGEPVGSRVHPATLALLETMTSRYRHLHGMWLPVPREALCIAVVRALLADGCAALAAPVLAPLRRGGDGALSERAASADALDALCISVCLAKAAELIRAEGSRHACTGENQVDLSRFIRLLRGIVDALDVDLAAVSPLLVRFALSRGFWRLGHALVTDEWHGSCSSRDSALASVALHPFTCAMAGSISHLVAHTVAQQVLEMAVLPDSLWSTAERKGKCLQLILHGLTVANDGNTGALAVLAACVMVTHFTLLCARNDFAALRALLLANEAAADESNAAAFAWLMRVCNPADFSVGGSTVLASSADQSRAGVGCGEGRASGGVREAQGRYGADGTRRRRRAWKGRAGDVRRVDGGRDTDDSCEEDDADGGGGWGRDEEAKERKEVQKMTVGVAEKCLMWVLVLRFRHRLRLALTAPLDSTEEAPAPSDAFDDDASQSASAQHSPQATAKRGLEGRRLKVTPGGRPLESGNDETERGIVSPRAPRHVPTPDAWDSASSSSGSDAGRAAAASWSASPGTHFFADLSMSWQRLKPNTTNATPPKPKPSSKSKQSSSSSSSSSFSSIKHHLKDAMQRAHARKADARAAAASSHPTSTFSTRRGATPALSLNINTSYATTQSSRNATPPLGAGPISPPEVSRMRWREGSSPTSTTRLAGGAGGVDISTGMCSCQKRPLVSVKRVLLLVSKKTY